MNNLHQPPGPAAGFLKDIIHPGPVLSSPRKPHLPAYEKSGAEALLERCFREMVRYYRHSGVGSLCRGLVHRMNTPLQVLFFQLDLLEQKSLEELTILPKIADPAAEKLQALHRYRMQKIRQFRQELDNLQDLSFTLLQQGAHEDTADRLPLNLNELYRQELDLCQANPFFKHQVQKQFNFQEGLSPIFGHYIDFSQSFRNLVDNALEAMQGAGRGSLSVSTALQNGQLLLQIGDTGSGITPAVMPLIFEPFFTTKTNGHAGLGLFMARRLLAPYGGEIKVSSSAGETRATVVLPAN